MSAHVAFVCAMPMELAPLKRKLTLREVHLGSIDAHVGSVGGQPVVGIVTGMGTALAAAGLIGLVESIDVTRVLVVGITGAVDDDTPLGTLIRPEQVVDSATGTAYRPHHLGGGAPHGTLWTTDQLTTDPGVLAGLRARGVVALDMETAALAAVCEHRGIPWSVFRAISDRATDGSVDGEVFGLSNQDGTPDLRAVLGYIVKHPGRIPTLARLAKSARLATDTAASAAISAVTGLEPTRGVVRSD